MKQRLYLPELSSIAGVQEAAAQTRLSKEQAHHLSRVLRLRSGAELALFDGQGREWRARLTDSDPRACTAEIIELSRQEEEPLPLVLGQSWLKGNAMDNVVQKAVELGATGLWLINAERCNVKLDPGRRANKLAHLQKVAISAAEQCGTLWLPEIQSFDSLHAALTEGAELTSVMLDPQQALFEPGSRPKSLMLLVGPEGGWSDGERRLAVTAEHVVLAGLGSLTLRAETVPLAALAAVQHSWGWPR